MANYLDANPEEASRVHSAADHLGLMPLVRSGEVIAYVPPSPRVAPKGPISAEDYVVGLEVLGFRFALDSHPGEQAGIATINPKGSTPPGWQAHSLAIMRAFDTQARYGELAAFLQARDGGFR